MTVARTARFDIHRQQGRRYQAGERKSGMLDDPVRSAGVWGQAPKMLIRSAKMLKVLIVVRTSIFTLRMSILAR